MKALPYQEIGIDFLASHKTACLWDAPGLGKSFQALSAAKKINAKNILIICPASVRMVWKEECHKLNIDCHIIFHKSEIGKGINILSYEGATKMQNQLIQQDWDLMINDEGHYLKNYATKRTQAIYGPKCDKIGGVAQKTDIIWELTGTPMPNNALELYPRIKGLFPEILKNMNQIDFLNRYCEFYYDGFNRLKIKKGKNLNELRDKLKGKILRRKKEDVLKDLPTISYQILPVEGNLINIQSYYLDDIKECLNHENWLDRLHEKDIHIATLRQIIGIAKVYAVIKWVEESTHDKIVIYAYHKSVIDELKKLPNSVYIDGSCTPTQREKAKNDFQYGNARIFIGQNKAAGTGLTLTAGSVMLMVEPEWNPADNTQIKDRIYRIGQKNKCLVYLVMIPGTIDEAIIRSIKRKMEDYKEIGL